MSLNRAVTFRLFPSPCQIDELTRLLRSQQQLYNAALEERRGAWKWNGRAVSLFDQFGQLSETGTREIIPSLRHYGLLVHRGTLKRLDRAFQKFFREKRGFPRFKGIHRWDSVSYPGTNTWKLHETGERGSYGRLNLMGIGAVKIRLKHGSRSARSRGGVSTDLTVRRRAGRWEAIVCYKDVRPNEYPEAEAQAVGIDRGVTVLAATVDNASKTELIENPRHLRRKAEQLAEEQRKLARCKRGSGRRKKQVRSVQRVHEKIRNARKNRNHQLSRRLVNSYGTLVLEDLKIGNMTKSAKGTVGNPGSQIAQKAGLNKAILDAGWGEFAMMLSYKAEEAGRTVVFVDPRYTSQICSSCGFKSEQNRDGTFFKCLSPTCGYSDHADLNAARNILARAEPAHLERRRGVT